MKETRRLDVLAIIGLLIGVGVVFLLIWWERKPGCDNATISNTITAFLKNLPESDLKADYEIMLPQTGSFQAMPSVDKIRRTVGKYPNSARLQLRLGVFGHDKHALRRAAELDPKNALPLYYLASKSPAREAVALLAKANQRKDFTWYPFPETSGLLDDLVQAANSSMIPPVYLVFPVGLGNVGKYALQLQKQGRTADALAAIEQAKGMGWRVVRREKSNMMDLLMAVVFLGMTDKYEQQIYTETGSNAGLARVEAERKRLHYLRAGERYYATEVSGEDMANMMKHLAPFTALLIILVAQVIVLFLSIIWWELLLFRSRKQAGSELHLQATGVFSIGRLSKLYAILFVPAIVVFLVAPIALNGKTLLPIVGVYMAGTLLPVILFWKAKAIYRKAYRQATESVRQEVGKSIPDRREFQRRMIGVQGGGMVFIVIVGLLVSGGTKLASDAYPWEPYPSMAQINQRESQFVKDLVAGKVKVPQKYIDEVKHEEMKRTGGVK